MQYREELQHLFASPACFRMRTILSQSAWTRRRRSREVLYSNIQFDTRACPYVYMQKFVVHRLRNWPPALHLHGYTAKNAYQ